MALDADSILQAYSDNADYAETGSVTKAKAFATACRRLMALPVESGTRESNVRFDMATIRKQLEDVNRWLDANEPGGGATTIPTGVTRADFRNFR